MNLFTKVENEDEIEEIIPKNDYNPFEEKEYLNNANVKEEKKI